MKVIYENDLYVAKGERKERQEELKKQMKTEKRTE